MNVLVFDTETSNINHSENFLSRDNMVFNIGGVIFNVEEEKVVDSFNFLVSEIWEDEDIMENFYFKDRIDNFKDIEALPFLEVRKRIKALVDSYKIKEIYAYNINFDRHAVEDTCNFFRVYVDFSSYKMKDIYSMACDMVKRLKSAYTVYCEESERFSPAGNRLSNAETVYGFLTGSSNYEEEHSALEDSKIECAILKQCLAYERKTHTKLTTRVSPQCWRWVQGV